MILNVWTVTSFFLAGVGFLLAAIALVIAARDFLVLRRKPDRSRFDAIEDRMHLLALIIAVLAGVRLLAWPHFYLLLKSYVPDLTAFGVMCVFGVTRIQPALVLALQWIKPLLLLSLGFWWLLGLVDRKAERSALLSGRLALAVPLAGLAMVDCVAEVIYLLSEKVGRPVTCCTQFLDTEAATISENISPLSAVGVDAPFATLTLYVLLNTLAIAGAVYLQKRGLAGRTTRRVLLPVALVLIAVGNLAVTRWTWLDTVAPKVLQLPYHHCVYELLTDTPALGLAAVMAILGNGCLLWPPALQFWYRRAPETILALQRSIYALCGVALASELLIVGVHII